MMATKKKKATHKLDELPGQSDAKAPLDGALLLRTAQPILKALAEDLLARAKDSAALTAALSERHAAEQVQGRTADPFEVWLRFFTKQVAAAWFLSCVFVRVLEDRGLVEQHRIAGPGALDSQQLFFELAPSLSERDYLLTVFRELSTLPGAADLFDAKHNPVWLLAPSAERASQLLQLFRTPNANEPALRFGQADTRFLGDLYQDLDEDVRERFALLQTPHFVESFILDRTLERAIDRFGLDDTTLIDPTCGSGHFLLGAFDRLFDHRLRAEPGLDVRVTAHKALNAVYGSDINPYAIAIARFRLTLAFLEKGGYRRLEDAPKLPLHLAVADSLLHNVQRKLAYQRGTEDQRQVSFGEHALEDRQVWERSSLYELEDPEAVRDVLHREHAAVVGNPPYITVKDKALREKYRGMYPQSAIREYSLGAPFSERFFQLAKEHGLVGMITANSFMKREFGKGLIERFLPAVDLQLIVNTSGAYIPGHGTPTVLLFGRAAQPRDEQVLTVLAKRGEPATPEDPSQGLVWSSIAGHWSELGFDNPYVTVAMTSRSMLAKHPWSLGGGGTAELKALIESRTDRRLADVVDAIGFVCMTRADDIYFIPRDALHRAGVPDEHIVENVEGEVVRDWSVADPNTTLFPYDVDLKPTQDVHVHRFLWPYRTMLWLRREPNGNHREIGMTWWEWSRFQRERFLAPRKIAYAFVATHNHFVLDHGGRAFKQSAPIIKLPESATEDDHLALLAYLNSSTACFWMKQVCAPKGGSGIGRGIQDEAWESRFEFDATKLANTPLPPRKAILARASRALASLAAHRLSAIPEGDHAAYRKLTEALCGIQEELDWYIYDLFGLLGSRSDASGRSILEALPEIFDPSDDQLATIALSPGLRPFEISLMTLEPETAWFTRNGHGAPPSTAPWSSNPRCASYELRRELIASDPQLRLLESPEYKRRWMIPPIEQLFRDGAKSEYLDVMESELKGVEKVVALRSSTSEFERAIISPSAAPFLAAHRYTDAGLDKRAAWERTWDLQRREDAGEQVGTIPVPPKYDVKDFRDANLFRLRGKLDVPKERFISYPGCESDEDGEPVYGWAGWNHLQQAQALAALYQARKGEGWDAARLTPMLAGLLELLPWLRQWHNEPSEEFDGLRLGEYFEGYVDGECAALGLTRDGLRAWRPTKGKKVAAASRGRAKVAVTMRDGSGDE
ncbi:MAG: hypothetical protein RLZZ450_706 [Pseudomonadota bacterium]